MVSHSPLPVHEDSQQPSVTYNQVSTPSADIDPANEKDKPDGVEISPNIILYTSVLVALLQPLQYGWSTSQLNLSTFNNKSDCDAHPVPNGKCLIFPGHSKLEWTFAANAWIVGGMIGSLTSGSVSDILGRKKVLLANCGFIIAGVIVQASVSGLWVFAFGRLLSGIASGCATGVVGGYINEISPPHLRNALGVDFQISITVGILLVGITFFFADTSSGWRYIAGFPIVLAGLFIVMSPFAMVESPAWLLMKGRREEAREQIVRLYGEENVHVAFAWLEPAEKVDVESANPDEELIEEVALKESGSTISVLFSKMFLRQMLTAIGLCCAQQLTGINAVFYYSSDIFKKAGISDDRVGTLIIDIVNVLPTFFSGWLATKYGNRKMMLVGMVIMFISAVCMIIALVTGIEALSIVFTATYVTGFGISLGPLLWVIVADLFPDSLRASASSICICCTWTSNLIVGISYPYIADALNNYGFVPFVGTLAVFYLFVFKLLPETSGLTSEEIQAGFRALRKLNKN
uniref:Hexose transporter 1 n=1 Tax=Globisporangium ultimum (strain ATCC 200006 / CBS 805.95 / DAOM BR144) TaxID=431595 RepID=K3W618_GLOUD